MKIYAVRVLDINEEIINKICLFTDLDKRHKVQKYINKKDKIRTLIGEVLLKTIIFEELKISNEYIKFDKNQYGKPFLKKYENFNFNISHSGDYVLCAVDNKTLGIDIEEIKNNEYKELAKNFFTTKEYEYIVNQDIDLQLNKFYKIWTLKESYIKCLGYGLSIPLKSFSIEVNKHENIKVVNNKEYSFKLFDMELDYIIAVCSLSKDISNEITKLNQNNLINRFFEFNLA
jgi:4'-phosphopantetheinyl transferase